MSLSLAAPDGYDIRARHPDRETFRQEYRSRSREIFGARLCRRDLRYGEARRETLDYFRVACACAPLVGFVHGGFWHANDKTDFAFVAKPFLEAGIAFAAINYPLAPQARLGTIVAAVGRAFAWLRVNASSLGVDPRRIVAAGHSAGGHLAASLLVAPRRPPGGIAGAIAVSGLFDLAPLLDSAVNAEIGLTREEADAHSPLRRIEDGRGALLLAVGGGETEAFRDQTRRFGKAWRDRHGGAEPLIVPDAHHYGMPLELADPRGPLFAAACGFVRRL